MYIYIYVHIYILHIITISTIRKNLTRDHNDRLWFFIGSLRLLRAGTVSPMSEVNSPTAPLAWGKTMPCLPPMTGNC